MKLYTEIAFVLDRSGSMDAIRSDAIGGFNRFIADHKSIPGDVNFTLVLFSHESTKLYSRVALREIPELTTATYTPNGTTALLDAIGQTIDDLGAAYDADKHKPQKVIFVILTDGQENASRKFTNDAVAQRIKHQTENYGWEFVFLGANFDAFACAQLLNIKTSNTHQYTCDSASVARAYSFASMSTQAMRVPDTETGDDQNSVKNLKLP